MSHRSVALGSIAKITSGGTPDRTNPVCWNGAIPWVKTAQIQNCMITSDDIDEWITQEGLEQSSAKISPKGTILMAMYGQGKTRGQVAILGLNAAVNQACAAINLREGVDRDYVYQQLLFRYESIRALSNTGSQENLNAGLIREIAFPLPPVHEQQRAAQILIEWDTAIKLHVRLIATKQRDLRGLMQVLFADGQHPRSRLSELATRVTRKNSGGNDHPLTISGRQGLISQSRFFDKRIAAEKTEHYTLLKRGEYAYNRSYSGGYPYGAIKRLDDSKEGIVSSLYLCFSLRPDAVLCNDYFIYYCEAGGFNHQIHQIAQEGARNHGMLNVASQDFFAMTMPVPDIEKQRMVIDILSIASKELLLLHASLEKLQRQKRGLMQKLLTNQGRSQVPEVEAA